MPGVIEIEDANTGRTLEIEFKGDKPPSDKQINEIMRAQGFVLANTPEGRRGREFRAPMPKTYEEARKSDITDRFNPDRFSGIGKGIAQLPKKGTLARAANNALTTQARRNTYVTLSKEQREAFARLVNRGRNPDIALAFAKTMRGGTGQTLGRAVVRSAVPTAAGIAGGALTAGAVGAAVSGPAAPIVAPIAAIVGGGLAAYGANKAQDAIAGALAPEEVALMNEQLARDRAQHPYASIIGENVLGLATPARGIGRAVNIARGIGFGVGGGIEAYQQRAAGEETDFGKIAASAGLNAFFSGRNYGLGRRIERAAGRAGREAAVTARLEAGARGVTNPLTSWRANQRAELQARAAQIGHLRGLPMPDTDFDVSRLTHDALFPPAPNSRGVSLARTVPTGIAAQELPALPANTTGDTLLDMVGGPRGLSSRSTPVPIRGGYTGVDPSRVPIFDIDGNLLAPDTPSGDIVNAGAWRTNPAWRREDDLPLFSRNVIQGEGTPLDAPDALQAPASRPAIPELWTPGVRRNAAPTISESANAVVNPADTGRIPVDSGIGTSAQTDGGAAGGRATPVDGATPQSGPVSGTSMEAPTAPPIETPRPTLPPESQANVAYTPVDNQPVPYRWAVVDANTLIPSNDDATFAPRPDYPQELQPRDRKKAVNRLQIDSLLGKLNPSLLGYSATTDDGAPIVGRDNLVESGNGRTLTIRRAYRENHPNAAAYRAFVEQEAARLGLSTSGIENPMLVRVREGEDLPLPERADLARRMGLPKSAGMSSTENAINDAERLSAGAIDALVVHRNGDVDSAANSDFVRRFFGNLSINEISDLVDDKWRLLPAGEQRIRAALAAIAYGQDEAIVRSIATGADDEIGRSAWKVLFNVAGWLAKLKDEARRGLRHNLDITGDLTSALRHSVDLRKRLQSVSGDGAKENMRRAFFAEIAETDMFGEARATPEAQALVRILDDPFYTKSGARVQAFLENYADAWERLPAPSSASGALLDVSAGKPIPSKQELIAAADRATREEYGVGGGLFDESPAPSVTQSAASAGKPGNYNTDTPEAKAYRERGGWKLHLTVDPSNYGPVGAWLAANHPGQFKILSGGDAGEKDFTVYVGSRDDANALSRRIESEIGNLLLPNKAGGEDTPLTPKVWGRFDVQKKGTPYDYYGQNGVPFDSDAAEIRMSRHSRGTQENPEQVAAHDRALMGAQQRIDADLRARYGEYYAGSQTADRAGQAGAAADNADANAAAPPTIQDSAARVGVQAEAASPSLFGEEAPAQSATTQPLQRDAVQPEARPAQPLPDAAAQRQAPATGQGTANPALAFLDEAEAKIRASLDAKLKSGGQMPTNMLLPGGPVGGFGKYAAIIGELSALGAIKIARGVVKFADFAAQMIAEYGEGVRPYLHDIWEQAGNTYRVNYAPALGPNAPMPEAAPPRKAAFVGAMLRVDKFNSPQEMQAQILHDLQEDAKAGRLDEATRGGTRTWVTTDQAAEALGLTRKDAEEFLDAQRRLGATVNAEILHGFSRRFLQEAFNVRQAADTYTKTPTAENQLALAFAIETERAFRLATRGAMAEAGRALNAAKMIKSALAEDPLKAAVYRRLFPDDKMPVAAAAPPAATPASAIAPGGTARPVPGAVGTAPAAPPGTALQGNLLPSFERATEGSSTPGTRARKRRPKNALPTASGESAPSIFDAVRQNAGLTPAANMPAEGSTSPVQARQGASGTSTPAPAVSATRSRPIPEGEVPRREFFTESEKAQLDAARARLREAVLRAGRTPQAGPGQAALEMLGPLTEIASIYVKAGTRSFTDFVFALAKDDPELEKEVGRDTLLQAYKAAGGDTSGLRPASTADMITPPPTGDLPAPTPGQNPRVAQGDLLPELRAPQPMQTRAGSAAPAGTPVSVRGRAFTGNLLPEFTAPTVQASQAPAKPPVSVRGRAFTGNLLPEFTAPTVPASAVSDTASSRPARTPSLFPEMSAPQPMIGDAPASSAGSPSVTRPFEDFLGSGFGSDNTLFLPDVTRRYIASLTDNFTSRRPVLDDFVKKQLGEVGGFIYEGNAKYRDKLAWKGAMRSLLPRRAMTDAILDETWEGIAGRAKSKTQATEDAKTRAMKALEEVLDPKNAPEFKKFAKELSDIDINDPEAIRKLNAILSDARKTSLWDRAVSAIKMSWLSSPVGAFVDGVSTGLWTGTQNSLVRVISGAMEEGAARVQGRVPERYIGEVGPATLGFVRSFAPAAKELLHVLQTGQSAHAAERFDLPQTMAFTGMPRDVSLPRSHPKNIGRAATRGGVYLSFGSAMMRNALNEAQFRAAEVMELHAAAYREARQAGLRGKDAYRRMEDLLAEPTDAMIESAERFARQSTFTDSDEFLNAYYKIAAVPIGKSGIKPLQLIFPFVRARYRILTRALELTPFGAAKAAYSVGTPAGERMDMAARSIIGTSLLALAYSYLDADNITAAPPENQLARERFYDEGKRPYSIKINGEWRPYDKWSGPFGIVLGMVGAFKQKYGNETAPEEEEIIKAAGAAARWTLIDNTDMSTAQGLIEALRGEGGISLPRLAASYASGLIPNSALLRNVATAQDQYLRDPKTIADWVQQGMPDVMPDGRPSPGSRIALPIKKTGQRTDRTDDDKPIRNTRYGAQGFSVSPASPVTPESKLSIGTIRQRSMEKAFIAYNRDKNLPKLTQEEIKSAKNSLARRKERPTPEQAQQALLRAKLVSIRVERSLANYTRIERTPEEIDAKRASEQGHYNAMYAKAGAPLLKELIGRFGESPSLQAASK